MDHRSNVSIFRNPQAIQVGLLMMAAFSGDFLKSELIKEFRNSDTCGAFKIRVLNQYAREKSDKLSVKNKQRKSMIFNLNFLLNNNRW